MAEERTSYTFTNQQIRALMIPLVLEQVLSLTVGIADSIMVSSVGEAAVSGISLVDSINILLVNVFNSLATGGAVIAAHRLGEKDRDGACQSADQLLLCVTGIAMVIMVFSVIFNRQILGLIFGSVEHQVMESAVIYFYITALSFPFLGIYNASAGLSRAMGNSRITMWISLLTNVVNIIGNAVLIFGFHLGISGAAFSTLISRALGAGIIFLVLRKEENPLHYSRKIRLCINWRILKDILKIGIPTGMDNCIFQVGKILLQSLVAGLGTVAITANAIVGTVAGIAVIPATAVGISMITIVGQALGAGDAGQARYYIKKLMGYSYLFMAVVNIGIIFLSGRIVELYQVTDATRVLAAQIIVFHSICAVLLYSTGFALPNALRAAMDATYTMEVSLGCMWIFRIGFSYLFVMGFHMGLMGIWAAMGVDWLFRSVCFVWRMSGKKWLRHQEI